MPPPPPQTHSQSTFDPVEWSATPSTTNTNDSDASPQTEISSTSSVDYASVDEREYSNARRLSNSSHNSRNNQVQRKFVVITDPVQAKDPRILKGIRRHVMHYGSDMHNNADGPSSSKGSTQRRFSSNSRASKSSKGSTSKKPRRRTAPATAVADLAPCSSSTTVDTISIVKDMHTSLNLTSEPPLLSALPTPTFDSTPNADFDYDPFFSPPQVKQVNVQMLKQDFVHLFSSAGMQHYFDEKAASNQLFFLSCLCISTAYVDTRLGTNNNPSTLELGLEVSKLLQENMKLDYSRASDYTIASVANVAFAGDVNASDSVILTHYDGLRRMVQWRGGLRHLGMNGALAKMVVLTGLSSAIFRERQPHQFFTSGALQLGAQRDTTPPRLESPLCSAQTALVSVTDSPLCTPRLNALLQNMHYMCEMASRYERSLPPSLRYESYRDNIRATIHTFIPSTPATEDVPDNIYECCRLTAVIMEESMYHRVPFSVAVSGTTLVTELKSALSETDLDNSWGDMAGVLVLVTYVAAAASFAPTDSAYTPSLLQQWLTATAVRATMLHIFDSGEEVIRALYKLLQIQRFCEGEQIQKPAPPVSSGILGGLLSAF